MTDQLLVREQAVEQKKEPPGQTVRWPRNWPESRAEFGALVGFFQDRLIAFAMRRLGRLQDAEDVVQDVFVNAYTRVAKATEVRSVSAYLYHMTANACTDLLRKRKHAGVQLDTDRERDIPDRRKNAFDEAATLEELRRIETLLSSPAAAPGRDCLAARSQ